MLLENFNLYGPNSGVELSAFGRTWDLHNEFHFEGMRFEAGPDELVLSWRPSEYSRDPGVRGCRLRFRGVTSLEMTGRDGAYPSSESSCLETIDKVTPGEREYPLREEWLPDQPFEIEITFHDERRVRIGAQSAVFEIER